VFASAKCLSGSNGDPLIEKLLHWLPLVTQPCFLVGGAIRDGLLRSLPDLKADLTVPAQTYDFDLLVPRGGISLARCLANEFGAAFYVLDHERDVGRVVFGTVGRPDWRVIDVAAYQGITLWEDLARRDFCVNAMAVDLTQHPLTVLDPLGGIDDLRAGRLRATSEYALSDDAVRALRAVRLCAQFGFRIDPHTAALIHAAAPLLSRISSERVRDELMKILSLPNPATSLKQMDTFGLLDVILPELNTLKGLPQPGSTKDCFAHSIQVTQALYNLLEGNHALPDTVLPYYEHIIQHLATLVGDGYDRRVLLILAALLHDIGKPSTFGRHEDGNIHYFDHEKVGSQLARKVLARLHFSRPVNEWVASIVRWHLRPLLLAREVTVSRRALHRFFRDVGEVGVSIALLALAENATADRPEAREDSDKVSIVVGQLLEAYFERRGEIVSPPPLLSGGEIVDQLGLSPGPLIGTLLRDLQEAQAAGEVTTRAQAWEWIRARVDATPGRSVRSAGNPSP